jgi:hypothetical protein
LNPFISILGKNISLAPWKVIASISDIA